MVAALGEPWSRGRVRVGSEALAALPWLADEDPVIVAIAAARVSGSVSPAISERWARRLRVAVRRLDRYANFGAGEPGTGIGLLLDHVLAERAGGDYGRAVGDGPWPFAGRTRTLGGVAMILYRLANKWRRQERRRRR